MSSSRQVDVDGGSCGIGPGHPLDSRYCQSWLGWLSRWSVADAVWVVSDTGLRWSGVTMETSVILKSVEVDSDTITPDPRALLVKEYGDRSIGFHTSGFLVAVGDVLDTSSHGLRLRGSLSIIIQASSAGRGGGVVGSSGFGWSEMELDELSNLGSLLRLFSGRDSEGGGVLGDDVPGSKPGLKGVFQGSLNPADESTVPFSSEGKYGGKKSWGSLVLGRGSRVKSASNSSSEDGEDIGKNLGDEFLHPGVANPVSSDGRGGQTQS